MFVMKIAFVKKSRHVGKDGVHGRAAYDHSSDVEAGRRWMALTTASWAKLKISHFLASEIFSGTEYFWMSIIEGH